MGMETMRRAPIAALLVVVNPVWSIGSDAQIKARLFADYGPVSTRPGLSSAALATMEEEDCQVARPDQIRVQAWVEKWITPNFKSGTYGFSGYLRTWWTDPRLRYNGTADGGCVDKLSFGQAERAQIWKPTFYWEGARSVSMPSSSDGTGELLEVYPDGSIWWSRQVSFELSCGFAANLTNLPFDTHTCKFTMGMYADTTTESYLRWKEDREFGIDNHDGTTCMNEWFVTGFEQEDLLQVYSADNYTYAQARISFSRSPKVMLDLWLFPAMLMLACAYCGFYIDPRATPARVALGMLAIVVSANNFLNLGRSLPASMNPPWLMRVAQWCLYFNGLAMVEVVIVSFGTLSAKWLQDQKAVLASHMHWSDAIIRHRGRLISLLREWDTDGNGEVTRKEFRKGVEGLNLVASKVEVNRLFDHYDDDGDGKLSIATLFLQLENDHRKRAGLAPGAEKAVSLAPTVTAGIGLEMSADEAEANDMANDLVFDDETPADPMPPQKQLTRARVNPSPSKSSTPNAAGLNALTGGGVGKSLSRRLSGAPTQYTKKVIEQDYRARAREDLDMGRIDFFKVFTLFPILAHFARADHYARVIFPVMYAIFIVSTFSEVDYFEPHFDLLRTSRCYRESV